MFKPRITLGILNYKYDQYLPEAIECAFQQDYENKEILVVYNGWDGKDTIYLNPAVDRYYILKENTLIYGGRNAVFHAANTEWVYMLDADDLIKPNTLSRLMSVALETNADGVTLSQDKFTLDVLKIHNPYSCPSLLKKKIWESVNGYQETGDIAVEDWDFWIRVAKNGTFNIQTIPDDLYNHRWHGDNESIHYSDSAVWSRCVRAIKEKHKDLYE